MQEDFLKLKVSEGEKDEEWYKYQRDRLIPAHNVLAVEDYDEMDKLYKFVGNDLTSFKQEIAYYCGSLDEFGATEEDLVPYNPIPNKFEVLKGDMLARGFNHRIMLMTAKAIRRKNEELLQQVQESVNQELSLAIEEQKAQMQGMKDEEMKQYIDSLRTSLQPQDINRKNFLSEAEIIYSKLLQYTLQDQDVKTKKLETLEDALIVSRVFLYNGWKGGRPYIQVLNPKHLGFNKNPNTPWIQNGDYVWYRDEITVADGLDQYINKLDKEELRKMVGYGHSAGNIISKRHLEAPVFDHTRYYSILDYLGEALVKGEGLHQGTSLTNVNLAYSFYRTHLEFKAYSEVIFLTQKDEYGEKITIQLDGRANVIPKNASRVKYINRNFDDAVKYVWTDEFGEEYEAEVLWIPRRHELTTLGSDILTDFRVVPFQPDYGLSPYSKFELSYKGGILFNRNTKWVSPLMRALPNAFQYMAAKRLQDREMAKYTGHEITIDADQVPDELAADHEQNPEMSQDRIFSQEVVARKTGRRFVSSSRSSNGLPPPPTRSQGVMYNVVDTSPQLLNLQQFCQLLDAETGMRLGIPPQREAMTVPNTTATDNRQALVQSTLATQSIFYYLDKVWAHALNEHMYNLKTMIDGHFADNPMLKSYDLEYILPDGAKEFFAVIPEHLKHMQDIGLYLHDSDRDQVYFQMMMNSVFSFAQNAGEGIEQVSAVLKALSSSTSVEEVHKIISMESDRIRQRMSEQQQQQQQLQEQATAAMRELEKFRSELKLEADLQRIAAQREVQLESARINSEALSKQYDIDQNKENDLIQKQREQNQFDAAEKEKDRKHDSAENDKKLAVERMKANKPKSSN